MVIDYFNQQNIREILNVISSVSMTVHHNEPTYRSRTIAPTTLLVQRVIGEAMLCARSMYPKTCCIMHRLLTFSSIKLLMLLNKILLN